MEFKQYLAPEFELVRRDETDKVFFQTSGGTEPGAKSAGATLTNVTSW